MRARKAKPVGQHKGWPRRFEKEVRRLQGKLGLLDWTFRFKVEEGNKDTVAQVEMDRDARDACFTVFLSGPTSEPPERVALHECLHVLYTEAFDLAAQRAASQHPEVMREEHRAIERLCNFILGPL